MSNQNEQIGRRGWRALAECQNTDPELFFPTAESGPARTTQVAAAKAVCARCPVRAQCLTEALARIPYGIAGGLTEHERRTLRRRATTSGQPAHPPAAEAAPVEAALFDELPGGLTARSAGQERARVGRALLSAGRSARQVARTCGVSTRTVQRWAGEGSAAATGLPSGSPEHISSQAGTRAQEGDRA